MRKTVFILGLLLAAVLTGCDDIGKARIYFDQGVEQMMVRGDFAGAEESFNKAVKCDGSNPEIYYYLGCVRFNRRNFREAIPAFEKAIELKPDYADAYFSLGRTYDCLHDDDMSCYYYRLAEKHGRPNMHDILRYCL